MTVLLDTGVLYAHHDRDATRYDAADAAMDALFDGEFGQPYVTEYVYDEAITLTRGRTDFQAAKALSDRILGEGSFPSVFELLHVGRDDFRAAVETWTRYDDQPLSFTDASLIATCERRGIDGILSFDSDFDGLVTRYDPAEYQ
ncbi:type II toxin-antitoxin system VapC family toxin [Natronomonas sp. EA1]|uniref:type II toxin-antitoxin system VapC family toxin n=1 Tax=Natronomonas sp. EA1 TaxID=3421655 RepID=UPI003EBBF623